MASRKTPTKPRTPAKAPARAAAARKRGMPAKAVEALRKRAASKPPGPAPLNAKQLRFVEEYLIDLNCTQAAARAGYSEQSAEQQGFRLLKDARIKAEVEARMAARSQKTGITAERVLQELGRLAFFDLRKLYRPDGSMLSPHEWDDDTAAAMAGLDVVEELGPDGDDGARKALLGYVKKAKVFDKGAALTLAMRHLGMLKDKLDVAASVSISLYYGAPPDG